MIGVISIFYLLLATYFSSTDELTKYSASSLSELNLLKKPLNLYITANGVHNVNLYYLEAKPPFKIKYHGDLLYLHGAAYSSRDWNRGRPSIIQMTASAGYRVIAIDLPGFRNSRSEGSVPSDPAKFLDSVIKTLDLKKPIIVSPSASGSYSARYVLANQEKLSGFVPVAPCCAQHSGWENFTVSLNILTMTSKKKPVILSPPASSNLYNFNAFLKQCKNTDC
ncbi:unnamed protein product [Gongylonema pulchrum]|uniref:AB hydrolase-1 domain-containing protein n=1 Tax=Gongylonema pulchrum TaxID=637853 RepID=A0A183CZQ5_9BILA|nr:unnamed protein product [Gongylonema pulchrum]